MAFPRESLRYTVLDYFWSDIERREEYRDAYGG